jgi:hypothetical protein
MSLTKNNYRWLEAGIGSKVAAEQIDRQLATMAVLGKVYYVNYAAGGADEADSPFPVVDNSECFDTMQGAIDACVDNRGDLIIVKRGYNAITSPILFNKAGIIVVAQEFGMPPIYVGEYFAQHNTGTTQAAAVISKPCKIVGLGFETSWASGDRSSSLLIEVASGWPGWIHLLNCRFPNWAGATDYAINCEAGANMLIEECSFEGTTTAFTGGIAFGGSPTQNPVRNIVRNCVFEDCTYAIDHIDGTPQNFLYHSNFVIDGKFLNSRNAAADGLMCNNWLETATDTGSYDITVNALQANGIQVCDQHYAE